MGASDNRLLTAEQLDAALADLDGWALADTRLFKQFRFAGFPAAIAFMTEVAFAAARLDHHPNWSNVYDRVEVELWSHDLGGVSARCVELAAAMNQIAGG